MIFLSAVPSFSAPQPPSAVFLDCDTLSEYSIPNKGQVVQTKLHFKIDFENSDVLELNPNKGIYESFCKDPEKIEFFRVKGTCLFTEDMIYADATKPLMAITALDQIYFYRKTGKIGGSRRTYSDNSRDILELIKKSPIVEIYISGNCQQGVDLSPTKRAF